MRGVVTVVALFLAGCSTAGGDTTTTVPLSGPTTTATTPPSITTSLPTTTTDEECAERDGLLRTRRGFICPPTMSTFDVADLPAHHLPGVYATRQFLPGFTFIAAAALSTRGESARVVEFDHRTPGPGAIPTKGFRIYASETATRLIPRVYDRDAEDPRAEKITLEPIEMWGTAGQRLDFTLGPECPSDSGCNLGVAGWPTVDHFVWNTDHRIRFVIVDVPGGPIGIEVFALRNDFDTYWADVVQPILDSIEFLEP